MGISNNKYARFALYSITILLIYYIISGIKNEIVIHNKEIFEYPIYEAFDDPTVILIKVFTDVSIILGIILVIIIQTLKNRIVGKQRHYLMTLILLKCFEMLVFISISFLFLHGMIDDIFEETSFILVFAVFHSVGYFIFVPVLYYCIVYFKWNNKKRLNEYTRNGKKDENLEEHVLHC